MKGHNLWSYAPYRPFLTEVGDIYICRLAPNTDSIHVEWLESGADIYQVYYRTKQEDTFTLAGETNATAFTITGLQPDTDYVLYVCGNGQKSRERLARTGDVVGTVVNYLHPDDQVYSFSGRFLCSPSLVRHPDGFLLASMDVFNYNAPQNLTLIFRSDDNGETWQYVSELMPCFWGKMFIHKGELYMLSVSTEYGDLLIGKSTDGGKTFCAPITLLRGSNGKNGNVGVHKNPQNMLVMNDRLYGTLEWGSWPNNEYKHAAMCMSCNVDDDLLDPANWSFTPPIRLEHFAPELADVSLPNTTIEGTLAVAPDGTLLNCMRFSGLWGKALTYKVDIENPDAPLSYHGLLDFPGNFTKFMIKKDEQTNTYYSIASTLYDGCNEGARNYLCLLKSKNLTDWDIAKELLDYRDADANKIGFQYVDFEIENDDIIFLCRTAMNGANSFHDTNYSTFHRIENFREM